MIGSINERLRDVVAWGERIERYVDKVRFEDFVADTKTQDAVIRCLEIVGEASAQILRVQSNFEMEHPELELSAAYRARNRTAHGYGSVDLATIWQAATIDCPRLVANARRLLRGA